MEFRIRIAEGQDEQPLLLWDSVWDPQAGQADWALSDPDETGNIGGLRARAALETAVVLSLFTDRRCPEDHPLRKFVDDGDLRGWWGDGIDVRTDLGETEMGSLLWLLERAPLTGDGTYERWAEQMATEALEPLIAQGVIARIEAKAEANAAFGRLDLAVNLYGSDGRQVFSRRWDDVWKQVTAGTPSPGPGSILGAAPAGNEALDFSDPANSQYLGLV